VGNPQYWGAGMWAGEGSVEFVTGPTIALADFSFQADSGNCQRQNALAAPTVAVEVAVHLKTPWWSEINQQEDKDLIRAAAESELNKAYRGYVASFTFDEQKATLDTKRRHVWVHPEPGPDGNVGVTYPMMRFSDVYLRSLENALLTVKCPGWATTLAECSTQTGIPRLDWSPEAKDLMSKTLLRR
jgi:hypothetical protein